MGEERPELAGANRRRREDGLERVLTQLRVITVVREHRLWRAGWAGIDWFSMCGFLFPVFHFFLGRASKLGRIIFG